MKLVRYSDKGGGTLSLGLELHWDRKIPKWMQEARTHKGAFHIVTHFGNRLDEWYFYYGSLTFPWR